MTTLLVLSLVLNAATFALLCVLTLRKPRLAPSMRPTIPPISEKRFHITATGFDGTVHPAVYHGDDERDSKNAWNALKAGSRDGHFELWDAHHPRIPRDRFTRRPRLTNRENSR